MALLSFPPAPVNGELYPVSPIAGQNQYIWEATTSTWRLIGAATGVVPGTYGSATAVPQLAVDQQGRLTSVADVLISFPTSVPTVTAPAASTDTGSLGDVAQDSTYFYFYDGARWQRIAWDSAAW